MPDIKPILTNTPNFVYSDLSLSRLRRVHPKLKLLFHHVLLKADHYILCGVRSKEDQDAAFEKGTSQLKWPNSKHNIDPEDSKRKYSLAIDVAPYPYTPDIWERWPNRAQLYLFAGVVYATAKELNIFNLIRWGGDWDRDGDFSDQKFDDLYHWELMFNVEED